MLLQLLDAPLCDLAALSAFERERARHHGHRENAELTRNLRHHRRRARAGAAPHARCNEQHVCAANHLCDALMVFQGCLAADIRRCTCPQAFGDRTAQLQQRLSPHVLERLRIGVCTDELHPLDVAVHHVVDGVATATTDSDHLDHRALRHAIDQLKHRCTLLGRCFDCLFWNGNDPPRQPPAS